MKKINLSINMIIGPFCTLQKASTQSKINTAVVIAATSSQILRLWVLTLLGSCSRAGPVMVEGPREAPGPGVSPAQHSSIFTRLCLLSVDHEEVKSLETLLEILSYLNKHQRS